MNSNDKIIFESNTDKPTEFTLPSGEIVINFGNVQIIERGEQ